MKRVYFFIIALFIVASLAVASVAGYGWHLFKSPGPLDTETVFLLEKGTGLRSLSKSLHQKHIINNDLAFVFGVKIEKMGRNLRAGEYLVPAGISGMDLMNLFVSGKVIERKITIPEGLESREIRDLILQAEGLKGEITVPMPEGAFLPETYHYQLGDTRDELVSRMAEEMQQMVTEIWKLRDPNSEIKTKEDLVTLASIVEKETALPAERPHVAGVFLNRLRIGMKLQSDPTVVYGITMGKRDLGRPLSKKDLASQNEYSTYFIAGLPKGPIANPGEESLRSVLAPLETKSLYFVADGTGGHAFAETLDEHNANVRKWRKLNKKKKN
jgi:peptidoglycan lytic transglycosylase G